MDFKKLYELSLLAEASYVKFDESEGTLFDALQSSSIGGKMSATQADDFVSTWEIASYQKNTDNGFSATLFRKKGTEEYVYACRGTEASFFSTDLWNADFGDIVTDGLAIKQIVDMYNDWTRLNTTGGEIYQAAYLEHLDLETAILLQAQPQDYENYVASLYAQGNIIIDEPGGDVYRIEFVDSTSIYTDERAVGADALNGGETISVTGHSLGGHLATAFTRLFPGIEAVTINGAGYPTGTTPGLSGNAESNISNLFSTLGGANDFSPGNILNLYGEEYIEFTTMDQEWGLEQPGANQPIFIEDTGLLTNTLGHGKEQMTDALAVYDLFTRLDSQLQSAEISDAFAQLNPIFEAATDKNNRLETYETLINVFGDIYIEDFTPIKNAQWNVGNGRENFYAAIKKIQDAIEEKEATVVSLVDKSISDLQALTYVDEAYRYALIHLSPFAISGADYSRLNADGELNIFDPETGKGQLSERYLADRAEMFTNWLYVNTNDLMGDSGSDVHYVDIAKGVSLNELVPLQIFPSKKIVFGDENNNTIEGTNPLLGSEDVVDHLYGMAGDDTLNGYGGDDHLEGGKGEDTLNGGEGNDTFHIQGTDDDYDIFNGGEGNSDKILGSSGDDTIRVHQFSEENSIEIIDGGAGDNDIIAGTEMSDTIDLSATTLIDIEKIDGGAGSDTIIGTDYSEYLVGGGGNDTLIGGKGNDILEGGEDVDTYVINSGDGHDTIIDTGKNILKINGKTFTGVFTLNEATGNYEFLSADGNSIYTLDASGSLQIDADTSITFQNQTDATAFEQDSFGIVLKEDIEATTTNMTGDANGNFLYLSDDIDLPRTITALEGNDMLVGGTGSDVLDGGDGDDCIYSRGGADTINGGAGNDLITGIGGESSVSGGDGDDIISASISEWMFFGAPHGTLTTDIIWQDFRNHWPQATTDGLVLGDDGYMQDSWFAGLADGTYSGTSVLGDSWTYQIFLETGVAFDIVYYHPINAPEGMSAADFRAYITELNVVNDSVYLFGDGGNDLLVGNSGDDYLSGGTDNDLLVGKGGADILSGDEGNDTLAGGVGDDLIDGGDGADSLFGESGADILLGGEGNDLLVGDNADQSGTGADTLYGGAGNDELQGQGGNDRLYGEADNDLLFGDAGEDILSGGDGNDQLQGNSGSDILYGDAGNDSLYGDEGNDLLYGGDGNDALQGGTGEDILNGGVGDDSYYFSVGDGVKHIQGNEGYNRLILENGPGVTGLVISVVESSLAIRLSGSNDVIYLEDIDLADLEESSPINSVEFADGQQLSISELVAAVGLTVTGTTESDNLIGSELNEHFVTRRGDDLVDAAGGNDTIDLGGGDDIAYGGSGDDSLSGGAGNDRLEGGEGDDLYIFSRGDGLDVISDRASVQYNEYREDESGFGEWLSLEKDLDAGNDTLVFGQGITAEDLIFYREEEGSSGNIGSNDLVVALREANNPNLSIDELHDKVVLKDWFYQTVSSASAAAELPSSSSGEPLSIAVIEGDYLKTVIGSDGTLGGNPGGEENEGVGLHHDPTGQGDFGWDSMRQSPFEGWELFSVNSDQTGLLTNNNANDNDSITTSKLEDLSALSQYDRYVRWTGTCEGQFVLQTDYFFSVGDERINMTSKITALTDLTNLSFLRSINADPDARYESDRSIDQRGLDSNEDGDYDDLGDISPENLVFSTGIYPDDNHFVGLYSDSQITHNSGVSEANSGDPALFLQGVMDYVESDLRSDNSIGIAFDLGDLAIGEEASVNYSYVLGTPGVPDSWYERLFFNDASPEYLRRVENFSFEDGSITTAEELVTEFFAAAEDQNEVAEDITSETGPVDLGSGRSRPDRFGDVYNVGGNKDMTWAGSLNDWISPIGRGEKRPTANRIGVQNSDYDSEESVFGNRIEPIFEREGGYLSPTDINQIIQEMAAYGATDGIFQGMLNDVRQHEDLTAMLVDSWQVT